jgi:tetratricopeptide (TPR) repeat protein
MVVASVRRSSVRGYNQHKNVRVHRISNMNRTALSRIRDELAAGRLDSAAGLLAQLTGPQREDPNVALLHAVLLRRQGRPEEALKLLADLSSRFPSQPSLILQRANALKDVGRAGEAESLYAEVLALRPGDPDALYNLASCNLRSNPALSGAQYLAAAKASPRFWQAYRGALECARTMPQHPSVGQPLQGGGVLPLVSVICCSVSPAKLNVLVDCLNERLLHWELVHISDARSLSEGYTRGLQKAQADLLVFCHDDIRILSSDFSLRLRSYLESYDLIGVAGSTQCSGPAALWGGPPASHGWICYREGEKRCVSVGSAWGPVVPEAQVLDGVFLAGHRRVFEQVGFDEITFDGFHLYDMDFTWRAHLSGARLAICQDLMIEHASRGNFDATWARYADLFRRKFPEIPFAPAAPGPNSVEITADSDAQAASIFAWIRDWLSEGSPAPIVQGSPGNQRQEP